MKSPTFFLFCARLNQAINLRNSVFTVPYSQLTLKFLYSLKRNHLIHGYQIISKKDITYSTIYVITIYLIYSGNLPLFSHLFIYSKKKQFLTLSHYSLIKFQKQHQTFLSPIFFLYTNKGFLTQFESIQSGIGGKLCVYLY